MVLIEAEGASASAFAVGSVERGARGAAGAGGTRGVQGAAAVMAGAAETGAGGAVPDSFEPRRKSDAAEEAKTRRRLAALAESRYRRNKDPRGALRELRRDRRYSWSQRHGVR